MWSYYLDTDLYQNGKEGNTLSKIVSNKRFGGLAAVSNLGAHETWTGHPMSAANTYG